MGTTNKVVRDLECAQPSSHCREVADTLARIGDKWTVMVVAALSMGEPLRYNEISRKVDGISQRMLTLTLKGLEQDGFVSRTMYPTIPPRVDYELTDLGKKLVIPLRALYAWAEEYRPAILAAREEFDQREKIEAPRRAAFTTPK
jgi:DNA-binding HxlR family transcriptional regulator